MPTTYQDLISDFENGNLYTPSDYWNNWTSDITQDDVVSTSELYGNYALDLTASNAAVRADVSTYQDYDPYQLEVYVKPTGSTGDASDSFWIEAYDDNANVYWRYTFFHAEYINVWERGSGNVYVGDWNPNDIYRIRMSDLDFDNETVTIEVYNESTNTTIHSATKQTPHSPSGPIRALAVEHDTTGTGSTETVYVDDATSNADPGAAPTNFDASVVSGDQIDLGWTDQSTHETAFQIYRFRDPFSTPDSVYEHDTVGENVESYSDTGLEDGEKYYYRVAARRGSVVSALSSLDSGVTDLPAPTLESVTAGGEGELTVEHSVNDDNTSGNVDIERRRDAGDAWTTIDQVSAGDSYTDTGLLDGESYSYRVVRQTNHASAASGSGSATTVQPAPSAPSHPGVGDTTAEYTWTASHNYGETRLEFKVHDSGTWQSDGTVDHDVETGSVTGLRNGEKYYSRLVATTEHTETIGPSGSFTTTLPDEDQPAVSSPATDELHVDRETQASNYGSARIQIRAAGASTWDSSAPGFNEQTVAYDTLTTSFTDLTDGEQYEIRARTETEHAEGAWTAAVTATTQFDGATNPVVASADSTSVTVDGTDESTNESSVVLEREERVGGEWRDRRVVASLGPQSGTGGISATDTSASPSSTYRYRWRSSTEHASATSTWTSPVDTPSLSGAVQARTGASGWRVRVEHANGEIRRPRTAGTPSYQPTVNGLPQVRVPVPHDEKWQSAGFDLASAEVWRDGRRLPVDELVDVADQADHMVLVLEPGVLQGRVQREVSEQDAHAVAEDIITTDAGLQATVDDPSADTRSDVLMQAADSEPSLEDVVPDAPFPADSPGTVTSTGLDTHETAKFVEAENADTSLPDPVANENLSQGEGLSFFAAGQSVTHSFSFDYELPAGDWQAGFLAYVPDDHGGSEPALKMTVEVDGTTRDVFSLSNTDWLGDTFIGQSSWHLFAPSGTDYALPAGDHEFELSVTQDADSGDNIWIDCLVVVDTRYTEDSPSPWEPTPGDVAPLDWPHLHPWAFDVETRDAESIEQVIAGELTSTWTSTANEQAVAISNDEGETWHEAANSSAVQADFASGSAQIRGRFTLSVYDSGSGPVKYDASTSLDSYELRASLEDTPLLVNKTYDGSALSVLNEIADYGHFIWQLTWDPDSAGYRVEWTQPGQRTSTVDPSVVDYSTRKRSGETRYGTVVVKGSNRPVSGERWTTAYGSSVQLYQDNILEGSEAVYNPSTGVQYERGSDYEMDYSSGAVTALSSGDLDDGVEYAVDYRYRTQGSYTSPAADSDALELTRDFPGASDDRECGQIALNIVKEIQDPVWEVELEIDELPPGQLLVDEFAWPIPTSGRTVEVRSVQSEDGGVSVTGRGRGLGEVVDDLRGRVEAVSQRS